MINILAALLSLGLGFGIACRICGNMLDRSNNIGDSRSDAKTYKSKITLTSEADNMDRPASLIYFDETIGKNRVPAAPGDEVKVRRMTEEDRPKSGVPRGAFVSKNTRGDLSGANRLPDWEKRIES